MTNIGKLPANGILVVVQYDDGAIERSFTLEHPGPYESSSQGNQTSITLKRPLPPDEKFKLTFSDYPSRILVSNEFGETSTIDTDLGWFRIEAAFRDSVKGNRTRIIRQIILESERQKPGARHDFALWQRPA